MEQYTHTAPIRTTYQTKMLPNIILTKRAKKIIKNIVPKQNKILNFQCTEKCEIGRHRKYSRLL